MQEDSGRRAAPVLAGRYRLQSQVGRGGTARVLRARDLRLDRPVAVKLFHQHADPLGRRRFTSEVRLLAALDHPGLVTVHDAGTHDDQPYLVLELIDGPTLGKRIDQRPFTPDEVRDLGARLAETLAYIHEREIVHRDVKPANILLDPDGRPRLTDFGLARLIESTGITASGIMVGTAAYLAPEQVLGDPVGPPADVYGLGLVLLECLTARIEYPGTSAESVMARLNRAPRVPGDLPDDLARTLRAMTQIDPAARPDAMTCVDMLRGATVALPRPRRHLSRKVAVVAAAVAAGAVAVAYPLTITDSRSGQPQQGGQVEPGQEVHVPPTGGSGATAGPGTEVRPGGQSAQQAGAGETGTGQTGTGGAGAGGTGAGGTGTAPATSPPTGAPAADAGPGTAVATTAGATVNAGQDPAGSAETKKAKPSRGPVVSVPTGANGNGQGSGNGRGASPS